MACRKIFLVVLFLVFVGVQGQVTSVYGPEQVDVVLSALGFQQQDDGMFGTILDSSCAVSVLNRLKTDVKRSEKLCEMSKSLIDSTNVVEISATVDLAIALDCLPDVPASVTPVLMNTLQADASASDLSYAVQAVVLLKKHSALVSFDETTLQSALVRLRQLFEQDVGMFRNTDDESPSAMATGHALLAISEIISLGISDDELVEDITASTSQLLGSAEYDEMTDSTSFGDQGGKNAEATGATLQGLVSFYKSINREFPISSEQLLKFAEYFVSQKNVVEPCAVKMQVAGLDLLNKNMGLAPTALTLAAEKISISAKGDEKMIEVRISDVFGQAADPFGVTLVHAALSNEEEEALVSNKPLTTGKGGLFTFDFISLRPKPGYYTLEFRAEPKGSSRFAPIPSVQRIIKITTELAVDVLQLDVMNEESESATRKYRATYPKSVSGDVIVAPPQKLKVSVVVKDKSGVAMTPHQSFLRFVHTASGSASYVRLHSAGKELRTTIDLQGNAITALSGEYSLSVLIGDLFTENAVDWLAASLTIQFPKDAELPKDTFELPKKIDHVFKTPEKRPPAIVSFVFTILVVLPLLGLAYGLNVVGANLSGFPSMSSQFPQFVNAVGFLGTLAAMIAVIAIYWLGLDMFTAIYLLGGLCIPALYFGTKALSDVQTARLEKKK